MAVQNLNIGLNDPIRTLQQTQSTPGLNPNGGSADFGTFSPNITRGVGIATPFQNYGVGAERDDNTPPNSNDVQRVVSSQFSDEIVPLSNVLDQYASYTYSLTLYLITPKQLEEMQKSYRINPATWQLLMQSGGAPSNPTGASQSNRNQYFKLDYYLDNLVIETAFQGKGTGQAHNITNVSFTITEPLGITLVKNLYNAVNDLYTLQNVSKDSPNFTSGNYVMAIRFYGYDAEGNISKRPTTSSSNNFTGDPYAIVEKYFPFIISELEYNVTSKGSIEYKITGAATPYAYNTSSAYGTIPRQFELVGETVGDVLNGKPTTSTNNFDDSIRKDSPSPSASNNPLSPPISGGANEDLGGGTINSMGMGA